MPIGQKEALRAQVSPDSQQALGVSQVGLGKSNLMVEEKYRHDHLWRSRGSSLAQPTI